MIRRSLAVLLAILSLRAPAAAQEVPLGCPEAGTVIKTNLGGEFRFEGANGIYCNFSSRSGKRYSHYALLADDGTQLAARYGKRVAEMWPLSVGKSTEIQFDEGGATWYFNYEVLRAERVTVPAGTFDTLVVLYTEQGLNGFKGTRTYWYAPQVGYFVKFEPQIIHGIRGGAPERPWEAVSIAKNN